MHESFLEIGYTHTDKNIFLYFFIRIFFIIIFLKFERKESIFNFGLVSYNVNLQPKY